MKKFLSTNVIIGSVKSYAQKVCRLWLNEVSRQ